MADDRLLLGIDIGTSSSKGVLVDLGGRVIAEHAVPHGFDMPRPGWAEQDADAIWWADFCAISRALIAKAAIDASRIAGVAVSAIAPTMLPLDEHGRPLRPAILYGIDTRAGDEIAEMTADLGVDAIFARTGHTLSAQSVGPKVLWYRKNQPEHFHKTRKIVTAATYLVFKLTDNFVVDNYVAPYFTPFFDVNALAWHKDWVETVCPLDWLPETRWSTERAGEVTANAAAETGIPRGTPVAVGTADALAEAVAAGAVSNGDLMVMYGTTMFLIQTTAQYRPHRDLWASVHLRPGAAILAAGMSTSGALLSWFRDELAGDERAAAAAASENAFALLSDRATRTPAGSAGLITLPYFSGERTPLNNVHAKGLFFGLTLSHSRAHLYRSCLEGIAYGLRHNIEAMGEVDAVPRRLVAIGGGAQDALWTQICSDVTGLPQDLPSQTIGAAYGDAYIAGLAAGLFSDFAPLQDEWAKIARRIQPRPETKAIYDELYSIYRDLYRDNRRHMRRLSQHRSPDHLGQSTGQA
ncbi:MAG: FGGY-family carbohydrate kinase [Chloroflexi bacterium]|nr:FGGY-family carbohydrate kinase [Chloroflexota bacterium]